jgi:hypothetical protein
MKCNSNDTLHNDPRILVNTVDSNVFALEAVLKSHPSAGKFRYAWPTVKLPRSIEKPDESL